LKHLQPPPPASSLTCRLTTGHDVLKLCSMNLLRIITFCFDDRAQYPSKVMYKKLAKVYLFGDSMQL
jgi:hypothetical protein